MKKRRVLILAPYPFNTAASQRFRFEQYLPYLKQKGYVIHFQSFLTKKTWNVLYTKGHFMSKTIGTLNGFWRRFLILFKVPFFHFVFIHREATPLGPPWVEWIISRFFRKKVIYDFDDAIWLPNTSRQNKVAAILKWHNKVKNICRWSYKVSAGNKFLADWAEQFCQHVYINPTTIDTKHYHNSLKKHYRKSTHEPLVIGWTGTHSTIKYLDEIEPVLNTLRKSYNLKFLVISDQPHPNRNLFDYIQWKKATEVSDLLTADIGIMPLTNNMWSKGKCGFKTLQYMALGIPPVATEVGANASIIDHGQNGLLVSTHQQWKEALTHLIENPELRTEMGKAARKKVEDYYSVEANKATYLRLLE